MKLILIALLAFVVIRGNSQGIDTIYFDKSVHPVIEDPESIIPFEQEDLPYITDDILKYLGRVKLSSEYERLGKTYIPQIINSKVLSHYFPTGVYDIKSGKIIDYKDGGGGGFLKEARIFVILIL